MAEENGLDMSGAMPGTVRPARARMNKEQHMCHGAMPGTVREEGAAHVWGYALHGTQEWIESNACHAPHARAKRRVNKEQQMCAGWGVCGGVVSS